MKKTIAAAVVLIISLSTSSMTCGATDEAEFVRPDLIPTIEKISADYGVSPELIEAMIETESMGRSDVSNGSCVGLMQVSTRYHSKRAKNLGVDLYSDAGNIRTGVDLLIELSEDDDDLYYVLARYNGQRGAAPGKANSYATKILDRAYELETVHGKHRYESK